MSVRRVHIYVLTSSCSDDVRADGAGNGPVEQPTHVCVVTSSSRDSAAASCTWLGLACRIQCQHSTAACQHMGRLVMPASATEGMCSMPSQQ